VQKNEKTQTEQVNELLNRIEEKVDKLAKQLGICVSCGNISKEDFCEFCLNEE